MSDIEDEIGDLFDDFPSLKSVAPFLEVAKNVRWFRSVGERPQDETRIFARDYADLLGFPEADPVFLPLWEDAAAAAENTEYDSPAWETEEQQRAALTSDVLGVLDEDLLEMVMTHVAASVSPVIEEAAAEMVEFLQIPDEEFVRAVSGAATQACYQAVLVGLASPEDDHPFVKRFQIFEAGHWPIAVIGNSFLIF
ncbi:MAG: hypothetical protein JKY60_01310 [Kordiimonadaceae bacterium]|nr:hypothetical protein [Kordiimonadaceae bacterium]